MTRSLQTRGIDSFEKRMLEYPKKVLKATAIAVNDTARKVRTSAQREILRELNFPKSYVNQRLTVIRFAKPNEREQEAVIQGRQRATSLARFGAASIGKGKGISVSVGRKGRKIIRRGFMIKLRRGDGSGGGFNQGVALRLKKGEPVSNKRVPYSASDSGLVTLYGPSVQQAFQQNAPGLVDDAGDMVLREFNRQFDRLLK